MFAGNIGENQDFDTLIAAAGLLRARHALRWVIVGSGRDQACAQKVIPDSEEGARIIEGAEAGLAVPAGRPEVLANAVARMMDTGPDARAAYADNGRRCFEAHYRPNRSEALLGAPYMARPVFRRSGVRGDIRADPIPPVGSLRVLASCGGGSEVQGCE